MARRTSPRLANAPLARAAVFGLRAAGRTHLGAGIGERFHEWKSRRAADELARIPGVEAVYLSGSSRRGVHLGYSDIDLLLVVRLDGVDHELAVRQALARTLTRHNRPIELFLHADYVESRDFELIRRLGNHWSLHLDRRLSLLRGIERRAAIEPPDEAHARVAALAASLGNWMNQSALLVEPHPPRDDFGLFRIAERLLRGVLSAWLDADVDTPLEALLESARPRLRSDAGRRLMDRLGYGRPGQLPPADFVATSLDVLDQHARTVSASLTGKWPTLDPPAPALEWPGADDVGNTAVELGFAGVEAATRGVGGAKHLLLVTTHEDMTSDEAIARHAALLERIPPLPRAQFGKADWPIVMTPAMRRAAAFIEPYPLLGAALAARPSWSFGPPLPSIPAPDRTTYRRLTTMALAELLWRPRGRAMRFSRAVPESLRGMAHEVFGIVPQLLRASEFEGLDFSRPPALEENWSERALLEALQPLLDVVRSKLIREHSQRGTGGTRSAAP